MPDSSESCDLVAFMLEGIVTDGNPYRLAFLLCAAVVSLTALVSTASSNYSQVDKLWSIVPFVYAWIPVHDSRTLLMACITTIWGVRLTSNFARRGGYKWPPWDGDEDYRVRSALRWFLGTLDLRETRCAFRAVSVLTRLLFDSLLLSSFPIISCHCK